jgi:deoxyribodipyrimidine photo-lyase
MKNFNSQRVYKRREGEPNGDGRYVLYWMHSNRRLYSNFALEYAVAWANKLDRPLVILETLVADYPWASDRFHQFMIDGIREKSDDCARRGVSYHSYLEPEAGAWKGLVERVAQDACVVVSDEYPAFIQPGFNKNLEKAIAVPFFTVDSCGMIPLALTDKAPYSAYLFRKVVQKTFQESWANMPVLDPLADLRVKAAVLDADITTRWPQLTAAADWSEVSPAAFDIDHSVGALSYAGNRATGLKRLDDFITTTLPRYGTERNDPDKSAASGMSPFLHFGTLGEHEIVQRILAQQPSGWSADTLVYNGGTSEGYYGGYEYVEKYLDELITWRGVGFHYAHHEPDYDKFESLPDWAQKTLNEHKRDERPVLYTLEQLEAAQTYDPIWNAAQRELVRDGIIHNYLRMLWGKKILEWTPDPETALAYMIELNNKYAIDGRDPNSYSGIFWCLGRFDRPWFERPIFGSIRYMSSDSAKKKIKMDRYLVKNG